MIRVSRDRQDEQGQQILPSPAWQQLAQAETATAEAQGAAHDVKDEIYGHDHVRAALEKLFYDKCAYCETPVAAGSPWDVEHFRPKGRVAENAAHQGYYWLAYTWSNLFLSCVFCNQRRQDKPRWGDLSAGPSAGKLDQFPLSVEANRVSNPGQALDGEDPLLLNPCDNVVNPEDHLRHSPLGMVSPRSKSLKAKASIAVYNLNRRRLKDQRRLAIQTAVLAVSTLKKAQRSGVAAAVADFQQFVNRLQEPFMAYAGAARAVVRDPAAFGIA